MRKEKKWLISLKKLIMLMNKEIKPIIKFKHSKFKQKKKLDNFRSKLNK